MKTCYDSDRVWTLFEKNHRIAVKRLQSIPVFCGDAPGENEFSGWVFEKCVQYCLREELAHAGLRPTISEQFTLRGRSRADLAVGHILVEIKKSGFFSVDGISRYQRYRKAAADKGYAYLYLTGEETNPSFRAGAKKAFGPANAFFLDDADGWKAFVGRVITLLKRTET